MAHPGSFDPRNALSKGRLQKIFAVVRAFVAQADGSLLFARLKVGCPEIAKSRQGTDLKSLRSFMHVGHLRGTICAWPGVEQFAKGDYEGYLTGLLLHEFGHLGSDGGERDADRWIFENFGIRIHYKGELDVEWVDEFALRRIVAHAKKRGAVNFRHS